MKNNEDLEERFRTESRDLAPVSRREALGKAAATALFSLAAASDPAASITVEPTRIELQVETDYLIRVLETFDGDMRKVLSAIVRSPFTSVKIDPPSSNKEEARDAILRALYSYNAPEDYLQQARWLKVEQSGSFLGWLTKKRYRITLPTLSTGEDLSTKTAVSLSNLEAGVAAGVLSYPLTYAYYEYEGYREEQEAKAKKEAAAAKKAAAAGKKKKQNEADGEKKEAASLEKKTPAAKKEKPSASTKAVPDAKRPKATGSADPKGPSQTAASAPAVEASTPAVSTPTVTQPAPAKEIPPVLSPLTAPVAPTDNAGMDAYDAYLKQAYAAAAAFDKHAGADDEPAKPPPETVTPPLEPQRKSSPFGSYLDNL